MVTLTIILLLLFVPPARGLLVRLFSIILGALGIVAFVARDSSSRRRWW